MVVFPSLYSSAQMQAKAPLRSTQSASITTSSAFFSASHESVIRAEKERWQDFLVVAFCCGSEGATYGTAREAKPYWSRRGTGRGSAQLVLLASLLLRLLQLVLISAVFVPLVLVLFLLVLLLLLLQWRRRLRWLLLPLLLG